MLTTVQLSNSSCISQIQYDWEPQMLEVTFHHGKSYLYSIDQSLFMRFFCSSSKGKFYNQYIKKISPSH